MEIIKVTTPGLWQRYAKLRYEVFTEEMKVPPEIEVDQWDCLDGSCDHFLIRDQGADIAAIRIQKKADQIQIQRFCVMKAYRHQGYGQKILEKIEKDYKKRGFYLVILDSKAQVQMFYEKCGYHCISECFIEAGIEHVRMQKALIEVRKYEDLPEEAIALRTAIFVEEQGFQDEFDERDHDCTHLVFFDDGQAVGTCRYFIEDGHYVLGRIAVSKVYRGRHLGMYIVNRACALMKAGKVILHAQLQAQPFYEKLGFTAYGQIEYEEHCPHIWMKKSLRTR